MYSLHIEDPITGEHINVFSDRVMELIDNGYSVDDILTISKQILPAYNRSNVFSNDMLYNYMLHLNIKDIKSLCQIDKNVQLLCKSQAFWKEKITQDFSGYIGDVITYDIKNYDKLNKAKEITDSFIEYNYEGEIYFKNVEDISNVMNLSPTFYNNLEKLPDYYDKNDITLGFDSKSVSIEIDYRSIYKKRTNVKKLIFKIFYTYPNIGYTI
jgi:hypothetical protein